MNERDAPALLIGFIDSGFFREIRIKYIKVFSGSVKILLRASSKRNYNEVFI